MLDLKHDFGKGGFGYVKYLNGSVVLIAACSGCIWGIRKVCDNLKGNL